MYIGICVYICISKCNWLSLCNVTCLCVFKAQYLSLDNQFVCSFSEKDQHFHSQFFSVVCSSMCSVKTSWALHWSLGMSIVVIDVLLSFRQSCWFSPMILLSIAYSLVGDTISQIFFWSICSSAMFPKTWVWAYIVDMSTVTRFHNSVFWVLTVIFYSAFYSLQRESFLPHIS